MGQTHSADGDSGLTQGPKPSLRDCSSWGRQEASLCPSPGGLHWGARPQGGSPTCEPWEPRASPGRSLTRTSRCRPPAGRDASTACRHASPRSPTPLFSTLGCGPCDCHEVVQVAWGTGRPGPCSTGLEPRPTPAAAVGARGAQPDDGHPKHVSGKASATAACGPERTDGLT